MIYLDNAATTYPKPRSVTNSVIKCIRYSGGNPGRSGHKLSVAASEELFACREQIAELFGGKPENVVFTLNATYALNLAIHSLAKRDGKIAISDIEHNSVLRTAAAHPAGYRIFDVASCTDMKKIAALSRFGPVCSPDAAVCRADTGLVVCNHVSNICGITSPVKQIGALCRKHGIPFVIDISQSAGIVPININECNADALCAPGHKGLYGLQGIGFVLFADKYTDHADTLRKFVTGGNGVMSLSTDMPVFLPERFEAGTLPTPSAASLAAGIRFVKHMHTDLIREHEFSLADRLKDELSDIPGVTLYGDAFRGGTVLFNIDGISSELTAALLDENGFALRGGYHCCPLGHALLNTPDGGAVRASFSAFNKPQEVDALVRAVRRIASSREYRRLPVTQ